MTTLLQQQLDLEAEMHGAGILRFTKNNQRSVEAGAASEADWFRRLTREFVKPMSDAIQAYKDFYKTKAGKPAATIQHLDCISSDAASYITIKTIFDSLTMQELNGQQLVNRIGARLEDEIRFTRLSEAAPEYIGAIKHSLKKRANKSYKFEHDSLVHAEREMAMLDNFQKLEAGGVDKFKIMELLAIDLEKYESLDAKKDYAVDFDRWIPWSQNDIIQVGSKMVDVFAKNMLLDGKPLIHKVTKQLTKRTQTVVISASEHLEAWVEQYQDVMGGLAPAYEPCVVKPRDWTSPFDGGYHSQALSKSLPLVKCRNKKHLRKLTKAKMPEVYSAVNTLQAVKWQINERILGVANEVRRRSLPLGMPSMDKLQSPECPVPAMYADLRGDELKEVLDDDQKAAFSDWKTARVNYYADEQNRRADVREALATIEQAIKFKDFDALHFVYTLDFRSRVYSQGSLVSPQGGDMQKALLRFQEEVALGSEGEYWFKVHGANVWAWDKEEFDTRVEWASTEEFQEMCLDIAADPISYTQWTNADKPWQFLAWCFEYADLIEWVEDGNDASDFLSRVAVAMDGSCSGIQHYSAMLRDEVGGKEVNLVPSSRPQDIYRAVSDIVNSWMESILDGHTQDVPQWDDIQDKYGELKGYKFAECWLRVSITRAMTKKPVMTLPYGSSQLTCRDSVNDYLTDLQAKADRKALAQGHATVPVHDFTEKTGDLPRTEAVTMASSMTWRGIGEVVIAARAAMKYIKQVTKVIALTGSSLMWTTPLGFEVEQAIYVQKDDRQVFTNMLGGCKFRVKEDTREIDVRGMQSSCAPNFVHSMDASHLMKAVNYFQIAGIESIAVIHDSFGTHAGRTNHLRHCLINSFVDMYQQNDVISNFKTENEERLMIEIDVEIPTKGKLNLEEVRNSLYAFG